MLPLHPLHKGNNMYSTCIIQSNLFLLTNLEVHTFQRVESKIEIDHKKISFTSRNTKQPCPQLLIPSKTYLTSPNIGVLVAPLPSTAVHPLFSNLNLIG